MSSQARSESPRPSTSSIESNNIAKVAAAPKAYEDAAFYEPSTFGGIANFKSNKRMKLKVQYDSIKEDAADVLPQIFKGLNLYINGFVGGDGYRELTRLIPIYGGEYVSYLDRKALVTHIIATTLTPKKRQEFAAYRVATPSWLTESIAAGELLPWNRYSEVSASLEDHTTQRGEADRLGTQTAQRSLLGMLGGAVTKLMIATTTTSIEAEKVMEAEREKEMWKDVGVEIDSEAETEDAIVNTEGSTKLERVQAHLYLPKKKRTERTSALLDDVDWMSKNTSSCPSYIASYFQQSRLHYLSTWKQELILLVNNRQAGLEQTIRRRKLTGTASDGRIILHVDFDSFFVACGLISRPQLKGKPVAVCHAKANMEDSLGSTSEIASCSYEARDCGVAAGMSLGRALEMCPDLQAIPFEFDLYRTTSALLYDILLSHSDLLQAISIDEAIMDVSTKFSAHLDDPACILAFAQGIRDEVRSATDCEVSIGISHNILLARLASRKAKPANVFYILPDMIASVLGPLPVDALPGIGWRIRDRITEQLKVHTLEDLREVRLSEMKRVLGDTNGSKFESYAKGIDDSELRFGEKRQSVSAEVNYGIRFSEAASSEKFVRELGKEVARRLKSFGGLKTRLITLKIMIRDPSSPHETPKFLGHGVVTTSTVTSAINNATDDGELIGDLAWKLLRSMNIPPSDLRGIAIQATKLEMDGVRNDAVLERGQALLNFEAGGAMKAKLEAVEESEEEARKSFSEEEEPVESTPVLHFPPANQLQAFISTSTSILQTLAKTAMRDDNSVDVIIISDSESEGASTKRRRPPSPPIKSPAGMRIARMFRPKKTKELLVDRFALPTSSQIRDPLLTELLLNPEVFRVMPRDIQDEQLENAFRSRQGVAVKKRLKQESLEKAGKNGKGAAGGQSRLNGTISKPSLAATSTIAKTAAPDIIVIDFPSPLTIPPLSPTTITDEQLLALNRNLDPDTFRELSTPIQREQILAFTKLQESLSVPSTTRLQAAKNGRHLRPNSPANLVQMQVIPPPSLYGKADVEDIQSALTQWVDSRSSSAPIREDIDDVVSFLRKCLSKKLGQDLDKVVRVMRWWNYLVESHFGAEASVGNEVGFAWWKAWNEARKVIDLEVRKEFGARLMI